LLDTLEDSAGGCLSRGQPGGHQILHLREKGEKNRVSLEVEATGKLRADSTFVCMRRLCRRVDVRILEDSRRISSGRVVLSAHRAIAARSAEARELFRRVQSSQSSGGTTLSYTCRRTQDEEFTEETRQRSRPLKN
jgi:hypothetical protein